MSTPPQHRREGWREQLRSSKLARVLSYRDFRLLWIGAFLSFTGSGIQKIAEGYFVYQLTHSETMLSVIQVCNSVPVFVFGFVAGYFADTLNKKRVMIVTMIIYTVGTFYLAVATQFHFITFWQIAVVALVMGTVSAVEMPTRQSIVSRVVPPEDLAKAVPVNAMTFNVARIFGPAIGGYMLSFMGVAACYYANGVSFLALIWSAVAIRTNLETKRPEPQPLADLLLEGARHTWRDPRLRTLLLLETVTATFGVFYVQLVPAYVDQALHLGTATNAAKMAIGHAYSAIGIGAMIGLLTNIALSDSQHKAGIVRAAMSITAVGLIAMAFIHNENLAYLAMFFVGGATVMQFNSTNSLFQTLAPERLRGRVLAMHSWALNGVSPFGGLAFGWLATTTRLAAHDASPVLPTSGIRLSLLIGGIFVLAGAVAAFLARRGLTNLS